MFASFRPHFFAACAASAALFGCAAPKAPPASAASTTATTGGVVANARSAKPTPVLMAAVRAEDDDADDDPRGILLVDGDVVSACRGVRDAKPPRGEENMQWLYMMRSIAACAKSGELGVRPIVLRGPARPQVIVKYIFSKLGVPDGRVVLTDSPDGRMCADDDCEPSDLKVDIGLGVDSAGATL